jgi:glycosyltransferase involved in cell wall biosynthesis
MSGASGAVPVLFVDHVPALSGGERSLLDLASGLDPRRYRPVLACPGGGELASRFQALGFATHALEADRALLDVSRATLAAGSLLGAAGWLRPAVATARQVAGLARAAGARLIHTNSMKAHVLGSLAARLAGLPLVWHVRDCLAPSWLARALGLLGRWSVDRAVAISDAVRDGLVRTCGVPEERVTRVYNGLPRPDRAGRPVLRSELGLPPGALVVGTVGQIARWKGAHVLLAAARRLPDVVVVIAGGVVFGGNEAAFSGELDAEIRSPGLAGRVFRLGHRDDVADVLASLDVFVHPVLEPEPFGRVLVEAMLQRRPIVASATGAVPEIVSADCGVLVPPGDPAALADAIAALAATPERRLRMGEAGAGRAASHFSLAAACEGVQAVYDAVLSARDA